jgi:hypothetical protein
MSGVSLRAGQGRGLIGVVSVAVALLGQARGDTWTDLLFANNRHDFGAVPRGAKVKHNFLMVNRSSEVLTIVNLHPSCGCTSGQASARVVAPGQSCIVEAQMDTRNFVGPKSTILFVTMMTSSGQEVEARLGVSANIRSELVLNPGSIDFGTVSRGKPAERELEIERINGEGWRFTRMLTSSRALGARLVETSRNGGSVSYKLTVSVKPDAPVGVLREELRLISNDPETPSIPVLVTGVVRGELSAAPSILTLGRVDSSKGATGRFVVRGSRPFVIESIEGSGDGFTATAQQGVRSSAHVVTVAYKPAAGGAKGDLRKTFRVRTDLADEPPLDLTAILHVTP